MEFDIIVAAITVLSPLIAVIYAHYFMERKQDAEDSAMALDQEKWPIQ